MKITAAIVTVATLLGVSACRSLPIDRERTPVDITRIAELDAYWTEVSRAVREGDFAAYRATVHPEGVLVSGVRGNSQPLSQALARWKKEFDDTKAGVIEADVRFRFSERYGDATTAHETGIFVYTQTKADGQRVEEYIHFVALLVKREGRWLILMENQASRATRRQWDALE